MFRRSTRSQKERWKLKPLDRGKMDYPDRPLAVSPLTSVGDDAITVDGQTVARVGKDGQHRWQHHCSGRPRAAHVSGDRLLVLTDSLDYHAWGHLGPALLLDLDDGRLVAELRGERGAALGDGRVVVGLEGYDYFHTWAHDRDGALLTTWHSYGHYVPDPDQTTRVIECDRSIPTSSCVARLLPGGEIERGPRLTENQAPAPVVLPDGTAVVLDAGVLRAFDRDLHGTTLAKLFRVPDGEERRFRGSLLLRGDRLTVEVSAERDTRTGGVTATHRWWTFAVAGPH